MSEQLTVLRLAETRESVWKDWDRGVAAKTDEANAAYHRRWTAIQALRGAGLIDENGDLTDAGAARLRPEGLLNG